MEIRTGQLWHSTFYIKLETARRRSLSGDIFDGLTDREKKVIRKAGIELMGAKLF